MHSDRFGLSYIIIPVLLSRINQAYIDRHKTGSNYSLNVFNFFTIPSGKISIRAARCEYLFVMFFLIDNFIGS